MNLDPNAIRLIQEGEQLQVVIGGGEALPVERVARAFPKTDLDHYVGLLGPDGHEIGMIENPSQLDADSLELLGKKLREIYFVPTIQEILSVEARGTGSYWEVVTDDGERAFRIQDREALDGMDAPSITVTDENGKRYWIENYWELDRGSREMIQDLLPDRVLRRRTHGPRTRR